MPLRLKGRSLSSLRLFLALTIASACLWADSIPISSDGSMGALDVPSGTIVFNTDFTPGGDGGTYTVNGVLQTGVATIVGLPGNPGSSTTVAWGAADVFAFEFSSIYIGPSVTVMVNGGSSGGSPLILASETAALVEGTFNLAGSDGKAGGPTAGGGGGGGGGSLSVFAKGSLGFGAAVDVNGGDGGLSYQSSGNEGGGDRGTNSAGGGSGGAGGYRQAGGMGGKGADGGRVGFPNIRGFQLPGINLPGGGGGGGGAYNGGPAGGGATNGGSGRGGGGGVCMMMAMGGRGGSGASSTLFGGGGAGGAPGMNGKPPAAFPPGSAGGGGGGGSAPGGTTGGAGAAGGIAAGGGGGGGGGDSCMPGPPLQNGGGGGGGGGDGKEGNRLETHKPSGGGGGAGQVTLGSNSVTIFSGAVDAYGGTGNSGDGGSGLLTLVGPSIASVGEFNGSFADPGATSVVFDDSLTLNDYGPFGGAGGGGAGGSGAVIPEPVTVVLTGVGFAALWWRKRLCRGGRSEVARSVDGDRCS